MNFVYKHCINPVLCAADGVGAQTFAYMPKRPWNM